MNPVEVVPLEQALRAQRRGLRRCLRDFENWQRLDQARRCAIRHDQAYRHLTVKGHLQHVLEAV